MLVHGKLGEQGKNRRPCEGRGGWPVFTDLSVPRSHRVGNAREVKRLGDPPQRNREENLTTRVSPADTIPRDGNSPARASDFPAATLRHDRDRR
jgi:hypothetical protein